MGVIAASPYRVPKSLRAKGYFRSLPVISGARTHVWLARYNFLLVFSSDLRSRWNCCREERRMVLTEPLSHTPAFSALTLLVGRQEEHLACKNWVMRCWCGYLSGARFRVFAYGPADATAVSKAHNLLPHLNPDWFYLSGTGLPRLSWRRGR